MEKWSKFIIRMKYSMMGGVLLLLAVVVLSSTRGDPSAVVKGEDLAAEKALTRERMLKVYEAIQAYRREHRDLPPSLGALHPKYVSDPATFICPTGERTGHTLPYPELVDPEIETHFGYEFSHRPMTTIWGGNSMRMRDFKELQMMVVGGAVPMLRCFSHGFDTVLNVTYDGRFHESPVMWESMWQDRVAPGEFSPEHLLHRVLSMVPDLVDSSELAWIRMGSQVSAQAAYAARDPNDDASIGRKAMEMSRVIEGYLGTYPEARRWSEAAMRQGELLILAMAYEAEGAETAMKAAMDRVRNRPGMSEDERYEFEVQAAEAAGARQLRTGDMELGVRQYAEALRKLIVEHPTRAQAYERLLMLGRMPGQDISQIAGEILGHPEAPESVHKQATAVRARERVLAEPLDMEFTAIDGRKVDLKTLRGKVVLIDFWATWCGPCVAEMPNLIEVHERYRDQGFEIIGISFDEDRSALEAFVAQRKVPWPQYYDGQGWNNAFGQRYGIQSLPTMWVLDRAGRIVEQDPRGDNIGRAVARVLGVRPKG